MMTSYFKLKKILLHTLLLSFLSTNIEATAISIKKPKTSTVKKNPLDTAVSTPSTKSAASSKLKTAVSKVVATSALAKAATPKKATAATASPAADGEPKTALALEQEKMALGVEYQLDTPKDDPTVKAAYDAWLQLQDKAIADTKAYEDALNQSATANEATAKPKAASATTAKPNAAPKPLKKAATAPVLKASTTKKTTTKKL